MQQTERKPLFDLGQLVATPGALAALEKTGQNAMGFLWRHVRGDWGELPKEDKDENQFSLEKGFRLLSSYRTTAGETTLLNALGVVQWQYRSFPSFGHGFDSHRPLHKPR